ncbi:MAG: TrkH family potassium uptake protein [Bacteroidales bacterium]|nr:TrkH family potassium uptake protein [Bacteroidales bacterium]
MNIKAISRFVGLALLVSALFMFLSIVVSLVDGRDSGFEPLLISFIITLIVGGFPFVFVKKTSRVTLRDGYMVIFLSWLLSFVFGMMPYIMWGGEFSLVNAWCERGSGGTTTGATILDGIEALPGSRRFWRSSTHFIGGLGVVVFLLLVIPGDSAVKLRLANLELSSLSRDEYHMRTNDTVKTIVTIYLTLFVTETIALTLAGMPFFDSVNHAFSNVATGGFSTKNLSIGYYDSKLINGIVMFYMIVAAMHFGLMASVVLTRSLKPLKNPVLRYFICCILILGLILSLSLKLQGGYESWGKAFEDGYFHIVCYITTTGFAIADLNHVPPLAAMALMIAGFQCACAGSTTGGLKADRIFLTFRAVKRQMRKQINPTAVNQVSVGGSYLRDETVLPIMTYIVLYIMLIVLSTMLLLLIGVDITEAFSGSLASVGNVGPALESIGTAGNYAAQPHMAKLIYTADMFLGRVEIYPILVSLSLLLGRSK